MRKVDPDKVKEDFLGEVDRLRDFLDRVSELLKGTRHKKADNSQLAQTVFLSTYVAFENYLSDLFLAYLNKDPTYYQREFNRRIEQSLNSKFHDWHVNRVNLSVSKHIKKDKIEDIVDPDRRNLTFKDSKQLKERAGTWLNPSHSSKIKSIGSADDRVIDTANSIRNFITHRSKASKEKMNRNLNSVDQGGVNAGLGRESQKVHKVGSFLKAFKQGSRRVTLYQERFRSIAESMV